MAKCSKPSFIFFATDLKERNGEGSMHISIRIEDMQPTNEQLVAAKEIGDRAAEELAKLLDL